MLHEIAQVVTLAAGGLGTFLNGCLIYLILRKSSEKLGPYKYFLLLYTVNAFLFTFMEAITLPTWYILPNGFFFLSTIDFLPTPIQQFQIIYLILSFTALTIIVSLSFLYRLASINNILCPGRSKDPPWLILPKYLPFVIGASLLLLCLVLGSVFPLRPSTETEQMFDANIEAIIGIKLSRLGYIGGEMRINGILNPGMVFCHLSSGGIMTLSSCVIIFCWIRIGAQLRKLREISIKAYRFQYRMYILLTIQTALPVVFNSIPTVTVFVLALADPGDNIRFCGMVLSFAQLLDPIVTVLLISEYKQCILNFILNIFKRETQIGDLNLEMKWSEPAKQTNAVVQ